MPWKDLESFSISHLQILDEKGKVDAELEPELSDEQLLELYHAMVLARHADERMLKMQRQGRIGTFPPSRGQEAVSVGATLAMRPDDWFVGAFRELGGRLMRGQRLERILQMWNGWEEGSALPHEGRTLPDSIVLSAQIPQAVGMAYAMKVKGEDSVAVAWLGDGATSEGDFHEGLNFAGVWKAPVVVIIQNNMWAISTPRSIQTASSTLAQKAIAYGIPGQVVDGNDVLAVYAATREAIGRARRGEGPTVIEAQTYRMSLHTTADDPTRYREDSEVEPWFARDPLTRFRIYLEGKKLWDEKKEAALLEAVLAEIAEAVEAFEAFQPGAPDAPFDHVYSDTHPELESQREIFLARMRDEFPEALKEVSDA